MLMLNKPWRGKCGWQFKKLIQDTTK